MILCVNCDQDAVYFIGDPGANELDYCQRCLPAHMHDRAVAGQFPDSQKVAADDRRDPFRGEAPPVKARRRASEE